MSIDRIDFLRMTYRAVHAVAAPLCWDLTVTALIASC
jgi:hypothetical protein